MDFIWVARLSLDCFVSVLRVVCIHQPTSLGLPDFGPSDMRQDAQLWQILAFP